MMSLLTYCEDSVFLEDELSTDNAVKRPRYMQSQVIDTKKEIGFTAEHFEEIDKNDIEVQYIQQILESSKLKLEIKK